MVLGGKLLTGYTGAASEIGHMVIAENGEECTCGSRGCFEAYSSATALIRDTKRTMAAHSESLLHAIAAEQGGVDGRTAFLAGSRYAVSHTRIELCTLGYRAGVIGAAMLARE